MKTFKFAFPVALLALFVTGKAFAGPVGPAVPEVNSSEAISALALLGGAVMVIRGRLGR